MVKGLTLVATVLLVNSIAIEALAQSSVAGLQNEKQPRFKVTDFLAQTHKIERAGLLHSFRWMPAWTSPSSGIAPAVFGSNLQVLGGGTLGRLTKWIGFGSNAFIGDSSIFEDKLGQVGIGTDSPTSRLAVVGIIETTLGGLKFPDGTVQASAGIAPNQVVKTLNGLKGDLTLAAGSNITITPSGNMVTIAAPNALNSVAHDLTMTGDGTGGSQLAVAAPLSLSASVLQDNAVITAKNTSVGQGGGVGIAVSGFSSNGRGVFGESSTGSGVLGKSGSATGVFGLSSSGNAVEGFAGTGLAGRFSGDVEVTGNLSKGGGSFKIDHPLDPENKYLFHSFVESPDMKNIYDGTITTDENGEAVVQLPDYFEVLNSDFRYQLTVIGQFAQAIVASEIKDNRFAIRTSAPHVKVSWQVTGIRQDAWARKNRIRVEVEKDEKERGRYLHPDAFGQPEEKGIEWVRHPELMPRLKKMREQAKKVHQPNER